MTVSVIVATYGDYEWLRLAMKRARPSAQGQGAHEVVVHHETDGTVASSRNTAAEKATGDHLLFVDADDELAPGYMGAMERALEQNGYRRDVLLTPAVSTVRQKGSGSTPSFFKEVPLRQANWLVIGTLISQDLFWQVGGFPDYPHGFEDWALWSKAVRAGATIVKVPDAVYRYWANPNSAHRVGWRDRKTQVATHKRVAAELDAWEASLTTFDPGSYDNAVRMMCREQRASGGR